MKESERSVAGFVSASTSWADRLLAPFAWIETRFQGFFAHRGRLGRLLAREHFSFFLLAAAFFVLISPRYVLILRDLVARAAGWSVPELDLSAWPYLPNLIPFSLLIFFVSFWLQSKWRLTLLLVGSLVMALGLDARFDLLSLAIWIAWLALAYLLLRLPLPRFQCALLLVVFSGAFSVWCHVQTALADRPIASLALFHASFLPMIWYSTYEHMPPKRRLSPLRFAAYHYARIFGSPVLTYRDLFAVPKESLARIRFDGFKALFVASFAATFNWAVEGLQARVDGSELTGLPLLLYSYLHYVGRYCGFVVYINSFIGVARLFGLPVRDNFNYWLLARTPNEHWRRWNILLREWIITYVFFPIMRAKRWLFVAVMASLLCSGFLHLIPHFIRRPGFGYLISSKLVYWSLHGLAIYLVIKIPLVWPGMVERLRMRESRLWSVAGIILTSIFYGILFTASSHHRSWTDVADYLARLFGVAGGAS